MGCYIWYKEEGAGRSRSPPRPILAVPNLTAHPSTASVLITVLLYNGPLLCDLICSYNSVVWSPYYKYDIEAIERVQRRFTKRLPGFKEHSYKERLKLLQLPSLELRRLHCDLIWCYKIVFGLVSL